jgi:DGQHR domain-containing protein
LATETPALEGVQPKGYLTFKAIKVTDVDRITYIGAMPVYDLIDKNFIAPVASAGLSPEILKLVQSNGTVQNGTVQRKTNAAHVQGILDYIVDQAEKGKPWAFNSIVLYSTKELRFEGTSVGIVPAGEAQASEAFSVGEGLHRCLAWSVALGLAKVKGVKRPEISDAALKRINLATIPVVVVEEKNLSRQKTDFNKLNQQKALTSTVLNLTDDSALSELTRMVIADVKLFDGHIDLNNASVGAKSDKLLSFAQLRFVVASYLLGRKTRTTKGIDEGVKKIVDKRGMKAVRAELREVFTQVASRFGGLERLQSDRVPKSEVGDFVRTLRAGTLFASNALWRALFVALHEAKEAGVDAETAIDRLKNGSAISWTRDDPFFVGSLIEPDTGRLLSSRESIDAATDKLVSVVNPR